MRWFADELRREHTFRLLEAALQVEKDLGRRKFWFVYFGFNIMFSSAILFRLIVTGLCNTFTPISQFVSKQPAALGSGGSTLALLCRPLFLMLPTARDDNVGPAANLLVLEVDLVLVTARDVILHIAARLITLHNSAMQLAAVAAFLMPTEVLYHTQVYRLHTLRNVNQIALKMQFTYQWGTEIYFWNPESAANVCPTPIRCSLHHTATQRTQHAFLPR